MTQRSQKTKTKKKTVFDEAVLFIKSQPSSYIKKKCVMKQKVGLKHFCGTAKHYSCLNKSTRATVRVVS